MAEYILRDQAIIAVTGAKLPDVSESGLPIANGKRSVTDCVRRLKEIPAADVRPVRRGKWEKADGAYCGGFTEDGDSITLPTVRCSVCKKLIAPVIWKNFCPNCGADMREES